MFCPFRLPIIWVHYDLSHIVNNRGGGLGARQNNNVRNNHELDSRSWIQDGMILMY